MARRSACKTNLPCPSFPLSQGFAGLLLLAMVATGCGDSGTDLVKVSGKIAYQGSPLSQGTIHLGPVEGSESTRPGVGNIDANGHYTIRSVPGRDGIAPGTYQVTIQSYTGSHLDGDVKYLIPQKYANVETSGLQLEVPANARKFEKNFDLQ